MYFIVFLVKPRENVVVPHTWIKDMDLYIEGFMNHSVNSNRKFKVFWSVKPEASDAKGIPLASYKRFTLNERVYPNVHRFPNEGVYDGQIRRFRSEF